MNCKNFRGEIVGDDPAERAAAERHAAGCPDCARTLREHDALAGEVTAWTAAAPLPPARLEARIAAAIERTSSASVVPFARKGNEPAGRSRRRGGWIATAAAVVLGLWLGWQMLPPGDSGLSPMERAMLEAERTRENYIRAVAELERQAAPLLARAADPELAPEPAALLLRYRDRLHHLDAVIAEVQGFLEKNPGHAGGDTVLLAAFQEKQQVLGEVLELRLGETS